MIVDIPAEIKNNISMIDVCAHYGIAVNRAGFACCPFHAEKTASFKVYPGRRGYCCFGCGATGDVIDFAKAYFGLSFKDAERKLNEDFALHILMDEPVSYRDRQRLGRELYEKRKQVEARRREEAEAKAEYWRIFDEYKRLTDDCAILREKLKNGSDGDFSAFFASSYAELIARLAYVENELEYAAVRRWKYEQRNNGSDDTGLHAGGLSQHRKAV